MLQKSLGGVLSLTFVVQKEMTGTAKACLLAKDFVGNDNFIYYNPDCLFSSYDVVKEIVKVSENKNVLSVFLGEEKDLLKFSVNEFTTQVPLKGKLNEISKILEKPTPSETQSRYMGF
jgi:dTDP-glucose pyrophosphorylase